MAELVKLSHFKKFDNKGFFGPKKLLLFSMDEWRDFDTKKVIGAKLNTVIWADNSDYGDMRVSNKGRSMVVKVAGLKPQPVESPEFISLRNPRGIIYGEYQNQLSVKADGFDVIQGNEGNAR